MAKPVAVPAAWPLVGRADEVEQVHAAVTTGGGAVLTGLAGVGKSRLASEVLEQLASDGWATERVTAGPETAAAPFSPFANLFGDDGGDTIGRIVAATRALEARGDRVVVEVDDAHHLDEVSVAFLRHLLTTTRVRVLLTVRAGAGAPASVLGLWQSGLLARIELFALAREETHRLVRLALPGDVGARAVDWVWDTTRGNPLFVHELVLDGIERGALVQRGGRWDLSPTAGTAGTRLQEVVAARVGSLSDAERAAIELLAVAEPIGLAMLESLTSPAAVAALADRELVVIDPERRRLQVRLAHPLQGEVVRSTMSLTTAREWRRTLIDGFGAAGLRRRSDAVRVAVWRCELGDVGEWEPLLAAAEELAGSADRAFFSAVHGGDAAVATPGHLEQAVLLARGALEGGGSTRAAATLVRLLTTLGRHDEAEAVQGSGGLDELALVRLRANVALYEGGDTAPARDALQAFVDGAADPGLRVSAMATLALVTALTGAPAEALALARPLLDDGDGSPGDRLAGMAAVAVSLGEAGRLEEAVALVDAAFGTVGVGGTDGLVVWLSLARGMLLSADGQLEGADEVAASCYRAAAAAGDSSTMGLFATLRAHVALERGHAARAGALAEEAIERLTEVDAYGAVRIAEALRLHAAALLRSEKEQARSRQALDDNPAPVPSSSQEQRARAWSDVASGRVSRAAARMQAIAETQGRSGHLVREAAALHDLVRLGHARTAVDRLRELGRTTDSAVVAAMADHAVAAAAGDGDRLAAVGERWEAMTFDLFAAEAYGQAAVCFERADDRARAGTIRACGDTAAARCGAVSTPALQPSGPVATLTRREREVADLAAGGMSDRQIADDLVVSARTVQTHLYNTYAKLGVDGRADLAAVLGRARPRT